MRSATRMTVRRRLVGGLALSATVLTSGTLAAMVTHSTGARAATTPAWATTSGKVVHLTLIAGYNNANAGFNFDGAAHGQMTVTVPLGDTIDVTFTNKAQGAQHNVVIIPYTRSLPAGASAPAFPGAASPRPRFKPGSFPRSTGAAQTFSFVAGKAGSYTIVCGIAGHALAGMWDNFVVSPTAKVASVTFGAAQAASTTGTIAPPANPNQWVSTSGKVVRLTLIAGYNNANAGFNFDGGALGKMVVTVPLGDKIIATYKNDATTSHDVLVVPYQKTLPTHSVPTAFAGASYGAPNFGARRGGKGGPPPGGAPGAGGPRQASNTPHTFSFVAGKAGTYMIICGYPGHAIAGMWDTFVVSSTAKTASITFQ
ncbi:MAG TPA: sulfocyanin-like copper-binding protein [Chloroflexota bacterium]|nr:sulfocyanin-like copper-binding protein [Chloroflexota bacterium]